MKTYKIWEAIKMLTENPKLRFINGNEVTGCYDELTNNSDYLYWNRYEAGKLMTNKTQGSRFNGNVELHCEWTLVQQPVTFMEAVKSGKRLRVEHDRYINVIEISEDTLNFLKCDYNELDDVLYELSDNFNSKDLVDIIQNGKWYIEE